MRKPILMAAVVAVAAMGLAFGWRWWMHGRFVETTDNATIEADITPVGFKIAGHVREVAIADNQPVKIGDLLVALDDRQLASIVAGREAALAEKKARLVSAEQQVRLQGALIAEAEAIVRQAEAELTRSRQDHDRASRLIKNDFVSRQRFEDATAALASAEAERARAAASLNAARQRRIVAEADRASAEAELAGAEAELRQARQDLDDTVLKAPQAGIVANKAVEPGQYVRPGAPVLSIVPVGRAYVVANFKETQIARMVVGQAVEISVDAYPGETITGTIESLAPASGSEFRLLPVENASGNFTKIVQRVPVRIALPPEATATGRLKPGLSVIATVDTSRTPDQAAGAALAAEP